MSRAAFSCMRVPLGEISIEGISGSAGKPGSTCEGALASVGASDSSAWAGLVEAGSSDVICATSDVVVSLRRKCAELDF